jgi:hypothetical protein
MRAKFFTLIALIALAASVAMAHGDKKHVVGTLEKINNGSVIVKTADGKSVEVKLVASTMYVSRVGNEDKSAQLSDLAVGDRVAIHATPNGETLEANEVKFSAPPSATSAAKPKR